MTNASFVSFLDHVVGSRHDLAVPLVGRIPPSFPSVQFLLLFGYFFSPEDFPDFNVQLMTPSSQGVMLFFQFFERPGDAIKRSPKVSQLALSQILDPLQQLLMKNRWSSG